MKVKPKTVSRQSLQSLGPIVVKGASCLPRDAGRYFRESMTGWLHGPEAGKEVSEGPSSRIFLHRNIRASRLEGAKGMRLRDSTLAMAALIPPNCFAKLFAFLSVKKKTVPAEMKRFLVSGFKIAYIYWDNNVKRYLYVTDGYGLYSITLLLCLTSSASAGVHSHAFHS
jgi:hypothetical protein